MRLSSLRLSAMTVIPLYYFACVWTVSPLEWWNGWHPCLIIHCGCPATAIYPTPPPLSPIPLGTPAGRCPAITQYPRVLLPLHSNINHCQPAAAAGGWWMVTQGREGVSGDRRRRQEMVRGDGDGLSGRLGRGYHERMPISLMMLRRHLEPGNYVLIRHVYVGFVLWLSFNVTNER